MLVRLLLACSLALSPVLAAAEWQHGIAMHGEPKYGPDFQHFEYVNPNAPKGGSLRMGGIGTFDSLHPYILKGNPTGAVAPIYESLMTSSLDEAFTEYGLLAEAIEVAEDRTWVRFKLRPQARWHDGKPVRPEDVVFSFNTLKEKGHPRFRVYWADVLAAEKSGPREVRFRFRNGENRELPLIIGQMPVLPEHYWKDRDFTKTTLEPPLGSGPYRVAKVEPGRAVTLERVKDYWGKDLPVNRGRYNFDTIRTDYFRDSTIALEAFKAGAFDVRQENVAKNWAMAYNVPALQQGRLKKEEIPHQIPAGMQGFVFNTRRPVFQDPRVRQALAYAFDYEWTNANLFHGAYTRTKSYFANSELAARELPSPEELALLEPYRDQLPPEVFTQVYEPPTTDGKGVPRENLRRASQILKDAGWEIRGMQRVNVKTGEPMRFEILLVNPSFERVVLPFVRNLERLGAQVRVRTVDDAQYVERMKNFDFDLTVQVIPQSLSPGNEQRNYWGSEAARTPGSQNYIGVSNPVVDTLVEKIINAPDRESLIHRTRALDRVLLWNHYVIPNWHLNKFRVAYWDKFERPKVSPPYGLPIDDAWWAKSAK